MAESTSIDETVKEKAQEETKKEIDYEYSFIETGGKTLYTSDQTEFDDCFYQILALGSFAKTFKIGKDFELTFMTISQEEKMKLLDDLHKWGQDNKVSESMFQYELKRRELAHYLTGININGSFINLREADVEKRIEMLKGMADQAVDYYSLYQWVFLELVRRSLMSKTAVKN